MSTILVPPPELGAANPAGGVYAALLLPFDERDEAYERDGREPYQRAGRFAGSDLPVPSFDGLPAVNLDHNRSELLGSVIRTVTVARQGVWGLVQLGRKAQDLVRQGYTSLSAEVQGDEVHGVALLVDGEPALPSARLFVGGQVSPWDDGRVEVEIEVRDYRDDPSGFPRRRGFELGPVPTPTRESPPREWTMSSAEHRADVARWSHSAEAEAAEAAQRRWHEERAARLAAAEERHPRPLDLPAWDEQAESRWRARRADEGARERAEARRRGEQLAEQDEQDDLAVIGYAKEAAKMKHAHEAWRAARRANR